jgi:D-alanyl-D-alanine carboxypeptidase (penicillin-binding protein 5/6)
MDLRFVVTLTCLLAASVCCAETSGAYRSALVMDSRTGEVLFAENEHEPLPPASMVKMMTELIILELIAEGELSNDDLVTISAKSSRMGGSQVYLKDGETFTVLELLMALSIQSANDAAVALAEHAAGSTAAFVELMNRRAAELGMHDSEFHHVHGLPPANGQEPDLSSAYDMARLGLELTKHPEALEWAVMDDVPFRNGEFIMVNPNPLVGEYRGLEGIKTGYTAAAGFCLTAAATQKGVRLISVVMGAPTNKARGMETTRLLSRGFADYTRLTLVTGADEACPETVKIVGGKTKTAALVYAEPLIVGIRKGRDGEMVLRSERPEKLEAPAAAGTVVGRALAELDGQVYGEVGLKLAEDVAEGGFWDRLFKR